MKFMDYRTKLRKLFFFFARILIRNTDITLISNNCIAGCVLHDLGLKFNTPTINLYIPFPDYIFFLQNLKDIVNSKMEDITGDNQCPVGLLGGGVRVYFLHYKSFAEGINAWRKRAKRIKWRNIYVVLVERDGCTKNDIHEFSKLHYRNKIALTHKKYPINNSFQIKGFENEKELGNIMLYKNIFGVKFYDTFNWIKFLNKNQI